MRLTSRDVDLILTVYKYRYLSVSQIERLHFPSKRTAYRRLQALTTTSYLKDFTVPNIAERIFHLDKAGAEIVAGELAVDVSDLQWHRSARTPKDYYFLRHFLAINDFRITLTQACTNSPIHLIGYIPEYFGEKTPEGHVKKYLRDRVCDVIHTAYEHSHTPDSVFALEKNGKPALFFLEIDRGTEKVSDPNEGVLKSILFYLNYWVEEKFKHFSEDFHCADFSTFRVLIITTSGERIKNIRTAVTSLSFPDESVKRFLWITTQGRLTRDGIFASIWVSLSREDQNVYTIG